MGCSGCDWDPRKDWENQRKHRVKFTDACCVFEDPFREEVEDDADHGELRWLVTGRVGVDILVVVFTERNGRERIVSARKAERQEE